MTKPDHKGLFLIPLLLLSLFVGFLPSVPQVDAATPVYHGGTTFAAAGTAYYTCTPAALGVCTTTLWGTASAVGDQVVIGVSLGFAACQASPITISSVVTSHADTVVTDLTLPWEFVQAGQCGGGAIFHITSLVATTMTITVTASVATDIEIYPIDFSNMPTTIGMTVTNGCSSGACANLASANAITSVSGDVAIETAALFKPSATRACDNTVFLEGSPNAVDGIVGGECYFIATTPGTETPQMCTSGWPCGGAATKPYWSIGAVDYGGGPTVYTVTSCTFFQLQCWWYPLLFMGLYSGFLLMVASSLNVSPKGKAHIFLSALTYGSLIAVILGIMNIVFPLLMLILNTVIVLRFR